MDSDNDHDDIKVRAPPVRKKPRLPPPSDSEDDDDFPLASRKRPLVLDSARDSAVTDRNPVSTNITMDPGCTSTEPNGPSEVTGVAGSSTTAHKQDSRAVAGADAADGSKSKRSKGPAHVQHGNAAFDRSDKSSQSADVELDAEEQGQEAKARARTRKKGSRKRKGDEEAFVEEQIQRLTDKGPRAPKRRKRTPNKPELNHEDANDDATPGPSKPESQSKRCVHV